MTQACLTRITSEKDSLTFYWLVDGLERPVRSHHSTRHLYGADTRLNALALQMDFVPHDRTDTDDNILNHYLKHALGATVTVTQLKQSHHHVYIDWR